MVGSGWSFQVIDLPLEVWDLQITNAALAITQRDEYMTEPKLGQRQKVAKPKKLPYATKAALVTFWLTSNKMLTSLRTEMLYPSGVIKVKSGGCTVNCVTGYSLTANERS